MPKRQFREYGQFKVYKSFEGKDAPKADAVQKQPEADEKQPNLQRLITSDLEFSDIKAFICNEQHTKMTFYSSPYEILENNKRVDAEAQSFELDCDAFEAAIPGEPYRSIVVHNFFKDNQEIPGAVGILKINRTLTNKQAFEFTAGQDLNFVSIQKSFIYHNDNIEKIPISN